MRGGGRGTGGSGMGGSKDSDDDGQENSRGMIMIVRLIAKLITIIMKP